jgi:hypothetical protein
MEGKLYLSTFDLEKIQCTIMSEFKGDKILNYFK